MIRRTFVLVAATAVTALAAAAPASAAPLCNTTTFGEDSATVCATLDSPAGGVALPAASDAARSCKKKREARGCVLTNAEWGKIGGFSPGSAAWVNVVGRDLGHNIVMKNGARSANYPSAPPQCGVIMSTNSATLFGSGPRIKGRIKVGRTYTGRSSFRSARGEPGFRDPGGAFGGDASVQSLEATYDLTVKIVSARKVRVSASGTNKVEVLYRDPNSPDHDPKYIPGTFSCSATYSGTITRGRY